MKKNILIAILTISISSFSQNRFRAFAGVSNSTISPASASIYCSCLAREKNVKN